MVIGLAWGTVDEWGRVLLDEDGWVEALLRGADPATLVPDGEAARRFREAARLVAAPDPELPSPPEEDPRAWHRRRSRTLLATDVPDFDEIVEAVVETENDPERRSRLLEEIRLFRELDMEVLVRIAWLVVHASEEAGVALGCGRGSSCASYLLARIGLHLVDPVEHGVDPREFLRREEDT